MLSFNVGKESYKSDLRLGERYRDKTTGIEGTLVSITFYEHACERGCLRYVDKQGAVLEIGFDAPELVHIETGLPAVQQKPGGPERGTGARSNPTRR